MGSTGCCSILFLNTFLIICGFCLIFCIAPSESKRSMFLADDILDALDPSFTNLVLDGLNRSIYGSESGLTLEPQRRPNYTMVHRTGSCEETYGFLPCTESALGNLFLLLVYGFFTFKAASFLSDGSEMLLDLMGPGIIGGLLLPVLGALPDTLLIFVSGVSGSKEEAQQQVVIGMGLLAGSTVMLLTALWGACLFVGKCDLSQEELVSIDCQDTKGFHLCESGVTVDPSTRTASQIMAITIIPFIIAQIPLIFKLKSAKHASVLVASIVAFVFLLAYCLFQIFQTTIMSFTWMQHIFWCNFLIANIVAFGSLFVYCIFQVVAPWIQKRRLAFLKYRHVMSSILLGIHRKHIFQDIINEYGEPDDEVVDRIFVNLDADRDGVLSKGELRGLLVGLQLNEALITPDVMEKVMEDLDEERDNCITKAELRNGLKKWYENAKREITAAEQDYLTSHKRLGQELAALIDDSGDVEHEEEAAKSPAKVYMKAALLLLAGAVIAGVFADPLVDCVDNFSSATKIPSFFISFIAMPLATNSSEAISAIIFALRKRKQTASLTFSEIYGGVTMNNTLCLGVFLLIVYMRGLDWNFSAEVLVILIAIAVTGIMGSFFTTYKLWMIIIAFLMYPLTLVLVYVLDFILGWS